MRPWPEAILKRYPFSQYDNVLGQRPWWRFVPRSIYLPGHDPEKHLAGGRAFYVRHDEVELRGTVAERVENGDTVIPEEVSAALAAVDANDPLPHPGFRVGQVWAAEGGEATHICTSYENSGRLVGRIYHPGEEPTPFFDYYSGGTGHFDGKRYPFLVHDAVCPWFAPWSPS